MVITLEPGTYFNPSLLLPAFQVGLLAVRFCCCVKHAHTYARTQTHTHTHARTHTHTHKHTLTHTHMHSCMHLTGPSQIALPGTRCNRAFHEVWRSQAGGQHPHHGERLCGGCSGVRSGMLRHALALQGAGGRGAGACTSVCRNAGAGKLGLLLSEHCGLRCQTLHSRSLKHRANVQPAPCPCAHVHPGAAPTSPNALRPTAFTVLHRCPTRDC